VEAPREHEEEDFVVQIQPTLLARGRWKKGRGETGPAPSHPWA